MLEVHGLDARPNATQVTAQDTRGESRVACKFIDAKVHLVLSGAPLVEMHTRMARSLAGELIRDLRRTDEWRKADDHARAVTLSKEVSRLAAQGHAFWRNWPLLSGTISWVEESFMELVLGLRGTVHSIGFRSEFTGGYKNLTNDLEVPQEIVDYLDKWKDQEIILAALPMWTYLEFFPPSPSVE